MALCWTFSGSALSPIIMYGCVGRIFGLLIWGFRKLTPSTSSDPPLELDSVRGRRLAKFVYELLRAMFSFSACMPRMFGGVLWVGGGVGGTLNKS
jgi:hypothetical protein